MSGPGPRTLFLTSSYPRHAGDFGGHFVRSHARAEQAAARSVQVLAFGRPTGAAPAHEDPGIDVSWLGGAALFGPPGVLPRLREQPLRALSGLIALARAALRLVRLDPPERIVAHWLFPAAWPLALLVRTPGVQGPELEVIAHGSDVRLLARLPAPVRRSIWRSLAAAGARVTFVSAELRDLALASLSSDLSLSDYIERQAVAPSPLDLPEIPDRNRARQSLGVDPDERLLVIVGRLIESKRVDSALRAALLVPGARVVVLGSGPLRARLEESAPEATFLGDVPRDVCLTWLRAADALVCASKLEGAPTVVREARALGTQVVAVEAGDLRAWASGDAGIWMVG